MWPYRRSRPRENHQGDKATPSMERLVRGAGISATVASWLVLSLAVPAPVVQAAEIKVMSTVALAPTLDAVKGQYESTSGHTLTIVYSVIADLKKRIEAGETADVLILSRPALDDLQSQSKVATGSIVNLGRSYVAVGIRAGAPKPDITTA